MTKCKDRTIAYINTAVSSVYTEIIIVVFSTVFFSAVQFCYCRAVGIYRCFHTVVDTEIFCFFRYRQFVCQIITYTIVITCIRIRLHHIAGEFLSDRCCTVCSEELYMDIMPYLITVAMENDFLFCWCIADSLFHCRSCHTLVGIR